MAGRPRAARSISPGGSPSTLPKSRIAPFAAVGGEGGDQRRAVGAVALVDPRDQPLADVAREVEVDVGRLGDLLVQEAPEEQAGLDRDRRGRGRSGNRRPS